MSPGLRVVTQLPASAPGVLERTRSLTHKGAGLCLCFEQALTQLSRWARRPSVSFRTSAQAVLRNGRHCCHSHFDDVLSDSPKPLWPQWSQVKPRQQAPESVPSPLWGATSGQPTPEADGHQTVQHGSSRIASRVSLGSFTECDKFNSN